MWVLDFFRVWVLGSFFYNFAKLSNHFGLRRAIPLKANSKESTDARVTGTAAGDGGKEQEIEKGQAVIAMDAVSQQFLG